MTSFHLQPVKNARVVLDISTSMRWTGPPVGIVRVERELARWARANIPDIEFVFFDPEQLLFRKLRVDPMLFLTGEAALDTLGLTNAALPGQRRTDRVPPALKPAFLWIGQSRRMILRLLEKTRPARMALGDRRFRAAAAHIDEISQDHGQARRHAATFFSI
jgi:hypothetical protein